MGLFSETCCAVDPGPGAQFYPHPPDLPRYSPELESNTAARQSAASAAGRVEISKKKQRAWKVLVHYSQRRYRKVDLERSPVPPSKYRLGGGTGWCENHDAVGGVKWVHEVAGERKTWGSEWEFGLTFTTLATANHANGLVVHHWPGESGDPALPNGDEGNAPQLVSHRDNEHKIVVRAGSANSDS
ncbi:unnamed protein product [Cladocopium goreaui]|uniref:Uncharacterized protein n=1 Tax=Cladocopium goreaui TaxID=2562237 RepID=A0A9P1FH25_9DINO|nr:unnamed protein product [Cladocopium goreaui]